MTIRYKLFACDTYNHNYTTDNYINLYNNNNIFCNYPFYEKIEITILLNSSNDIVHKIELYYKDNLLANILNKFGRYDFNYCETHLINKNNIEYIQISALVQDDICNVCLNIAYVDEIYDYS